MLETICDTLVEAYRRNWITSRDGNVSIRHHDRDHFYITPSGVRKQTMQPDQFKKIGIKEGYYDQPPRMHAGIDLSTISKAFPELNRYTKVAPNVGDVAPISQELADRCHENLKLDNAGNIEYDIVGIKGHGVVAIDTSPWRAFEHIERLEHICQIVLASGKF